jgi:hypothetical protein
MSLPAGRRGSIRCAPCGPTDGAPTARHADVRALALVGLLLLRLAPPLSGQSASDQRHLAVSALLDGVVRRDTLIQDSLARHRCLSLPSSEDELAGPHGDSLVSARCEVVAVRPLLPAQPGRWLTAEYRWISVFTAEDSSRGAEARDTADETEMVVLEAAGSGRVRPVWHGRFETGDYAVWRSVTPELAIRGDTALLSVMSCVNGTGGCGQDFLVRDEHGAWHGVWQSWLDQLAPALARRIQHGVRIEPRTLAGHGGLYGPHDPNCCPSEEIRLRLQLRGDSLRLEDYTVRPMPPAER